MFRFFLAAIVFGSGIQLLCQTGVTVISSDYSALRPVVASPGQVVPIRFTGAKPLAVPRLVKASGFPLPTRLAGFAVLMRRVNSAGHSAVTWP